MTGLRRPSVAVFAVEDRTAQVTWRDLAPGKLRLQVRRGDDRAVVAEVAVEPEADVGGHVIEGLPPATDLIVEATGPAAPDVAGLGFRTLAALPGEELVRIATVNDLHLGAEVFGHRGTVREHPRPDVLHPVRCARAAIGEATAWGAARLVVKGDITNRARVDEWRTYAELVAGCPVPVDALPGNHDQLGPTKATNAALDPIEAAEVFGLSMAHPVVVRDLPGLRVVLAATHRPGTNRGTIRPVVERVVAAVAEADPARIVLVALHHQLQPHVLPEGQPAGVPHRSSTDLLDRLGELGRLVMVTSGHTHRHRRWERSGITSTQVGSTKDYPGVWAGYVVHEGGIRQVVRRVTQTDCIRWTDHTRRAALGAWRWISPGSIDDRCFVVVRPGPPT